MIVYPLKHASFVSLVNALVKHENCHDPGLCGSVLVPSA